VHLARDRPNLQPLRVGHLIFGILFVDRGRWIIQPLARIRPARIERGFFASLGVTIHNERDPGVPTASARTRITPINTR
jgi:hypothetical protein